jgi:hypothetical protein
VFRSSGGRHNSRYALQRPRQRALVRQRLWGRISGGGGFVPGALHHDGMHVVDRWDHQDAVRDAPRGAAGTNPATPATPSSRSEGSRCQVRPRCFGPAERKRYSLPQLIVVFAVVAIHFAGLGNLGQAAAEFFAADARNRPSSRPRTTVAVVVNARERSRCDFSECTNSRSNS